MVHRKRVVITGGAKGLGRAFTEAMVANGANVMVTGRDKVALDEVRAELGVEVMAADLAEDSMPHVVDTAVRLLGGLDVLVNNAADPGPVGPTWEVDADDWWRTMEINVRGTLLATNAALAVMTEGRIINLISQAGVHRWPFATAYAVSKAAVIKLTENIAAELRGRPIAVLGYDPGMVDIGMTRAGFDLDTTDNPWLTRMVAWSHQQREEGRFTPVEQSVRVFLQLAAGRADSRSGSCITASDDM